MNDRQKIELHPDDWGIQIKKADNGYLLEFWDKAGERPTVDRLVCEDCEYDPNKLGAEKDVLHHVLEHFGVFWSKHNRRNIKIEIVEKEEDDV